MANWVVHKFGGTSVAGPERYLNVVKILTKQPAKARQAVVVSAMSKVTDALLQLTELASLRNESYQQKSQELHERHIECVKNLKMGQDSDRLLEIFKKDFSEISEVLRG